MEYKFIEDLLFLKKQKIENDHTCIANNLVSNIVLHKNVHVSIFQSSAGMGIHLDRVIIFGGQKWTCSSAVTEARAFFRENDEWYFTEDKKLYHEENRFLDKVLIAVYEKIDKLVDKSLYPELTYIGNDLESLRGMMAQRKQDRHSDKEARIIYLEMYNKEKGDRYINKESRKIYLQKYDKEKGDRHTDQEARKSI